MGWTFFEGMVKQGKETGAIAAQDVANGQGVPSGAANLASALSRTAAAYRAGLMWEVRCWLTSSSHGRLLMV